MTVTPSTEPVYDLPTSIDSISPLSDPSHSQLHNKTNRAVLDLDQRATHLEQVVAGLTAVNGPIEQARLAAHEWVLRGDIVADDALLLPLIWNMTGRVVEFSAAKATLLTPAAGDVTIDIVVGSQLNGATFDPDYQSSVLKTPLTIPAGEAFSTSLHEADFSSQHAQETYVTAYVTSVGSGAPGVDLVVQLNRNL